VTTVAVIGPDGAGKSLVIRDVAERLSLPVAVVYMAVNLETSRLMLPTTRLLLEVKRRRGGRPDMNDASLAGGAPPGRGLAGVRHVALAALRLANWMAEEWFRQIVAWVHERRGRLVLFDRHFYCDYHGRDIAAPGHGRPWTSRVHGAMLERFYPRPDLVILLDAPAEVLFARKGEGPVERLERRRRELLALAPHVLRFDVVDANRPLPDVSDDVLARIMDLVGAGTDSPTRAPADPRSTIP